MSVKKGKTRVAKQSDSVVFYQPVSADRLKKILPESQVISKFSIFSSFKARRLIDGRHLAA
jgi:hypothetical protein